MQQRKRARAATVEDSMAVDTSTAAEIKEDSTESKEDKDNDKEDIDVAPMEIDGAASPDLPKCNACGLVGHSRRSNKHCLQHIPRVAEKNLDPNEDYSNVTVKVGCKKAIRGIELATAIEDHVRTMNLVRIHGSRVVLKYVVDKQSAKGSIMRQLFVSAFQNFHKGNGAGLGNEEIALSIHEYVMLAKTRQCDLPSIDGFSQSIQTVVKQYQTNCQVYVSTTLWGRVHRWLRLLLEIQLPAVFKNCARSKAAATYLMSCLPYNEPSEEERKKPCLQKKLLDFCKKKNLEQDLELALINVYSILLRYTHCAGLCLNSVSVKKNWDRYFGIMWVILRHFEEYGPKDCESRVQEQRPGRGLRLFNLVPLAQTRNLRRGSQNVTTQTPSTNIHQQPEIYVSPAKRFLANAEEEWEKVLRHNRVVPKNRSFSYSISTDGISLHLNLKKQISKTESTIDEFGFSIEDPKVYSPVDLKDRTVVGIDPNRKDLFMAYDGKQKFQVTAAKKKRENWLKKRNDIVNANSNVPTSKVSHVSNLHNHFFYFYAHLNLWFEFYGSRQWRQLRKRSSIKRQQALDLIVNRIIGKTERKCYLGHKGANAKQSRSYNNVFVAFGGGQFSSTSRGHHPIPRRSLINALKQRKIPMRLVDEFRTSMLCCKCNEPLPKRGMWHVKRCDNCNIFCNRDVNAAVNIREVFISVNACKGVRPGKFSSSYKFCSSTNT